MKQDLSIVYLPTQDLAPYARNSRTHSPAQVAQIVASIKEFGWTNPVLIDERGNVIAGHGRIMAANQLGLETVPTITLTGLTDHQRRAYVIADNKLALNAGWDDEMLEIELASLADDGFDISVIGFDNNELAEIMGLGDGEGDTTPKRSLVEDFGVPPFTVLDTRQGYWQNRRRDWVAITGDLTETKEGVLGDGELMRSINNGSSNFDPVLAEIMMRWFCPPGGKILDPFGGEQTKGVVAGHLGMNYHACEFRQEQVDVNVRACAAYPTVHYASGDSESIDEKISERDFDLCFTSPPYYDLEVYSKDDMSAFGTYAEFMAKYERIFAKCVAMLRVDAFLVVKIGEIRDKKTGIYRNFVGDNIAMFKRLGLSYYNELILLNALGTAPVRAPKAFNARKICKVHQNVLVFTKGGPGDTIEKTHENILVFAKGDTRKAAANCGDIRAVTFAEPGEPAQPLGDAA